MKRNILIMTTDVKKINSTDTLATRIQPTILTVIPNVLCQHADSAAALALDRFYALQSSDYNIEDLKYLESRLEANIDGLIISGEEGWSHYEKHLEAGDYGEVFVISVLAIKLHDNKLFQLAFEMSGDDEALLNAIADAFVWLPYNEVSSYLDVLYKIKKPEKQFVALAASAGHRQIVESHLRDALQSSHARLLSRAILAVAELGKKSLAPMIKPFMQLDDENIKFSACWALARFGNVAALELLKQYLRHPLRGEQALQLVVLQKDTNNTIELLRTLYKTEETRRLSIYGMGLLGNPKSIESLIKVMENEALARVASEAFSFITGVDIAYEDLDQDAPENFEGGPTDKPEDENIDMDPDEDLPWPNPVLIAKWWKENRGAYQDNKKYILGKEVSLMQYKTVLMKGTQKQRAFAAVAIAVHQQNQPIFNVCLPARRQKYLLGIS